MSSSRGPACRRPHRGRHVARSLQPARVGGPIDEERAWEQHGRRSRARTHAWACSPAIAAVVLLLAGLGAGVVDALAGAATGGLRAGLAATTGTDGAIRWQIRLADDPDAQAEAAAACSTACSCRTAPSGPAACRPHRSPPPSAPRAGRRAVAVRRRAARRPDARRSRRPRRRGVARRARGGRRCRRRGRERDDPARGRGRRRSASPPATWSTRGRRRAAADCSSSAPGCPSIANEPAWFGEPIVATGAIEGGAGPFVVDDDAWWMSRPRSSRAGPRCPTPPS